MRRSMFAGLKVHRFFKAVQALLGKLLGFPIRFDSCCKAGVIVGFVHQFRQRCLQAGVVHQQAIHFALSILNRQPPTTRAPLGLVIPFQQVHQQAGQLTDQGASLAFSHALNLLGEMLKIQLVQFSSPQKFRLFKRPGVGILLVMNRHYPDPPRLLANSNVPQCKPSNDTRRHYRGVHEPT